MLSRPRPRRPISALDRVVQHVTGDHTAFADPHPHVSGRVPGVLESHIGIHRVDEPGVDYGLHGIGECGRVQRIARLRKVIDISGRAILRVTDTRVNDDAKDPRPR